MAKLPLSTTKRQDFSMAESSPSSWIQTSCELCVVKVWTLGQPIYIVSVTASYTPKGMIDATDEEYGVMRLTVQIQHFR
jgi:hypothetical protein